MALRAEGRLMSTSETEAKSEAKEKSEAKDAPPPPEGDAPKNDAPKNDAPKSEPPQKSSPKSEDAPSPKIAPFPYAAQAAPAEEGGKGKKKKKQKGETAVRLKKVTKRFGPKTAVDEVTLKIDVGLVYGLIGPNGAGKTTTFSMLAGYLKPTEGFVEVLGFEPNQVDELRSRMGVLPQDAILPPNDRVGEFLTHMARLQNIPADKAIEEAKQVLEEVDGREWWKLRCGQLSHGMQKRVALAQALLGEPEVLLLDEPTAGLDPRVAYEMRQLIRGRKGRCTIIISSHNLHELEEICDAAVILDRGRVIASGSMSELTAASEEVHVKIAAPLAGSGKKAGMAGLPMKELRELKMVKQVEFDEDSSELIVYFERSQADAEMVIAHVLWILLNAQVRISGVNKGRGLEQRVMDLT
jgi:ABC-2 type transport system ATP-binding protein